MVLRAWQVLVCVLMLCSSGWHAVFWDCMHLYLYTIECSSVRPDAALCITFTRMHAFTCTHVCTRMFTLHIHTCLHLHACLHTHVHDTRYACVHSHMYICVFAQTRFLEPCASPYPLWDLSTLLSVWFKWCSTFFLGCSPHLTG